MDTFRSALKIDEVWHLVVIIHKIQTNNTEKQLYSKPWDFSLFSIFT